ncbi:MAG TPA: hypothetical protein VMB81_32170 [Candidatus Sulfotelmatobacter sp.]|nr:hypothetical protein [Candidatus Sulfotelmatobacter sp.]
MRELIVRHDPQLDRLNRSIAALEGRSVCEQARKQSLLQALYAEREELKRYHRGGRRGA